MADYKTLAEREFEKQKEKYSIPSLISKQLGRAMGALGEFTSTPDVWGQSGDAQRDQNQQLALKEAKDAAFKELPEGSAISEYDKFIRGYIKKNFGKESWASPIENATIPRWGLSNAEEPNLRPADDLKKQREEIPISYGLKKLNEYNPFEQARQIAELNKQNKETQSGIQDLNKGIAEYTTASVELGKGIDTAAKKTIDIRSQQQKLKDDLATLNTQIESAKVNHPWMGSGYKDFVVKPAPKPEAEMVDDSARSEKNKKEIEQFKKLPLEQQIKQAGVPLSEEASIEAERMGKEKIEKEFPSEVVATKKSQETTLKPKAALEMAPESMVAYRQEIPTNYAQAYADRYREAQSGRYGSTSSSTRTM